MLLLGVAGLTLSCLSSFFFGELGGDEATLISSSSSSSGGGGGGGGGWCSTLVCLGAGFGVSAFLSTVGVAAAASCCSSAFCTSDGVSSGIGSVATGDDGCCRFLDDGGGGAAAFFLPLVRLPVDPDEIVDRLEGKFEGRSTAGLARLCIDADRLGLDARWDGMEPFALKMVKEIRSSFTDGKFCTL